MGNVVLDGPPKTHGPADQAHRKGGSLRVTATLAPQRERTRAYLVFAGVREDITGYLCAALIGATFEAWVQWAAGTDPDPAPSLVAAAGTVRL